MAAAISWTELNPPERKRVYHFPTGLVVTLENVTKIEVRESGKHRYETKDGKRGFVSPGWCHLELDIDDWTC